MKKSLVPQLRGMNYNPRPAYLAPPAPSAPPPAPAREPQVIIIVKESK